MRCTWNGVVRGLPNRLPARSRSIQPGHHAVADQARSNSLITPSIPNSILPDGVRYRAPAGEVEVDVAGS